MVLTKYTTKTFHRRLYAGEMETVILLKRDDDQRQGVVTSYTLYQCRWSMIHRTGEPISRSMTSNVSRQLHIPRIELSRVGVHYINAADRFVDKQGRYFQPESTTMITHKLWENHICVDCLEVTPLEAETDV